MTERQTVQLPARKRARAVGAEVLRQPVDEFFGRIYTAADLEGHRWMFHQLDGEPGGFQRSHETD